MTLPASYTEPFVDRLPDELDSQAADQLRTILATQMQEGEDTRLKLCLEEGKTSEIALTPALSHLLMELLRHIGRREAVTLVPVRQMLTTQQAADILNVSRPHFIKLLEDGELPYSMTGRHRRIKATDLFEYKEQRVKERSTALAELAAIDKELI
ncbi:MAG: helix-turn-helix domain-containing protein [Geminicoccaceae bacterium]|nr:helix-turn-helix domain-containing protein [Geminicoccaceae bacterium]